MKPLERLTCRLTFRTGIIAVGAMMSLPLWSTPVAAENNDAAIRPFRNVGAPGAFCRRAACRLPIAAGRAVMTSTFFVAAAAAPASGSDLLPRSPTRRMQ